jgi:arsenite-transporting ATPase
MRIILYTGKGGVGKTTLSAATAAYLSSLGKKVLVVSVDPAHSLSDVLEVEVGPEPKAIAENLFAQEIDVYFSVEKYWGKLQEYLRSLLKWQGVEEVLAEEMSILPGMEEVSAFLWINSHVEEGKYDVIIVDSAPTGETLRFLSLPDAASWWITKVLPLQRKLMKFIRPVAKVATDMPLPEEETYDALEDLFRQVYNLYYLLQNPKVSSVRIVMNPEKMVLRETEKAYTYLHLFGFPVDAILVNRVAEKENFLATIQQKYLEEIYQNFYPTPIFEVPYLKEEVLGLEKLKELGRLVYGDKDPSEVFYQDKPFEVFERDGDFVLKLHLREVPKEKLEIFHSGDELTIRIGNFKKHFFLPRVLIHKEVKSAKINPPYLEITFG